MVMAHACERVRVRVGVRVRVCVRVRVGAEDDEGDGSRQDLCGNSCHNTRVVGSVPACVCVWAQKKARSRLFLPSPSQGLFACSNES